MKTNIHHVIWQKSEYQAKPYSRELRDHPYLKISLPIYVHKSLHVYCPKLEVPKPYVIDLLLKHLNQQPKEMSDLDRIKSLAIFALSIDAKIYHHINRQLYFIEKGLYVLGA